MRAWCTFCCLELTRRDGDVAATMVAVNEHYEAHRGLLPARSRIPRRRTGCPPSPWPLETDAA